MQPENNTLSTHPTPPPHPLTPPPPQRDLTHPDEALEALFLAVAEADQSRAVSHEVVNPIRVAADAAHPDDPTGRYKEVVHAWSRRNNPHALMPVQQVRERDWGLGAGWSREKAAV